MADSVARRIVVRGRVQGVFYRASTVDEASRLGVVGWVRNLPGGAVEAHAEGPADRVAELVAWMRAGPPMARVEALEETAREPEGRFTSFEVRR